MKYFAKQLHKQSATRHAIACFAIAGMCSCGGADTPVTIPAPPPTVNPTGTANGPQLRTDATTMIARNTAPLTYTELVQIQTGGIIAYSGFFYGDLENTPAGISNNLIGELNMQITFTPTSAGVVGTASQFVDDNNDAVSGQLVLSAGMLDRAGNPENDATFSVTATGQLTELDGDILDFGGQLQGDFLGATYLAIGGDVFGRIDSSGNLYDLNGGFIAEQ